MEVMTVIRCFGWNVGVLVVAVLAEVGSKRRRAQEEYRRGNGEVLILRFNCVNLKVLSWVF